MVPQSTNGSGFSGGAKRSSFQDRMRAVADADQSESTMPSEAGPREPATPPRKDTTPKRSSVIDMWRKREGAITAATANSRLPSTPKRTSADPVAASPSRNNANEVHKINSVPSYEFEEKKESTFEDEAANLESKTQSRVVEPQRAPSPASFHKSPLQGKSSATTTKPTESPVKQESTFVPLTSEAESKEVVPKPVKPKSRGSRASVLDRWNNREQQRQDYSSSSQNVPSSPIALPSSTPDSPAFSDLKSRWSKFSEVNKPNMPTPSPVGTPRRTPKPASPMTSLEKKFKGGLQPSPVTAPEEAPGLRARASPTPQFPMFDEAGNTEPQQEHSTSLAPRKDVLKRMGQIHAARPKAAPSGSPASTYLSGKPPQRMEVKPRSSVVKGEETDKTSAPRNLAQRKVLLEKHRRKGKADAEPAPTAHDSGHSRGASSTVSDGLLSQALDDTGDESQFQKLSEQLVQPSTSRSGMSPKVGTDQQNGRGFQAFSEYSSLRVSDSNSFTASEISRKNPFRENGQYGGPSDWNTTENQSSVATTPRGSIASRAHRTIRDKRMKNRELTPKQQNSPVSSDSVAQQDKPQPLSPSLDEEMYPLDEGATPSKSPSARSMKENKNSNSDPSNTDSSVYSARVGTSPSNSGRSKKSTTIIRRPSPLIVSAEQIISDKFVAESNTNVDAFATSLQSMSLGQIANDLTEEMKTAVQGVDFSSLSSKMNQGMSAASDALNANMSRATESFSKFVGGTMSPTAKADSAPSPTSVPSSRKKNQAKRPMSPSEEVAIEVEYVDD